MPHYYLFIYFIIQRISLHSWIHWRLHLNHITITYIILQPLQTVGRTRRKCPEYTSNMKKERVRVTVRRYRGDTGFLQRPHPSVHSSHDQNVLRLQLTIQQSRSGDLPCKHTHTKKIQKHFTFPSITASGDHSHTHTHTAFKFCFQPVLNTVDRECVYISVSWHFSVNQCKMCVGLFFFILFYRNVHITSHHFNSFLMTH